MFVGLLLVGLCLTCYEHPTNAITIMRSSLYFATKTLKIVHMPAFKEAPSKSHYFELCFVLFFVSTRSPYNVNPFTIQTYFYGVGTNHRVIYKN